MNSGIFTLQLDPSGAPVSAPTLIDSAPVEVAHPYIAGPENALLQLLSDIVRPDHRLGVISNEAKASEPPFPITLYGSTQTGKTHLALGLVQRWRASAAQRNEHPARALVYSGADFARAYANAVDADDLADFRLRRQEARLFVLDNVGALLEKPAAQHELALMLDVWRTLGVPCILTISLPPQQWRELSPALASRMRAGLVMPIAPPEPATRQVMLARMLAEQSLEMPAPRIAELAQTAQTYTQLEGLISTLLVRMSSRIDVQEEHLLDRVLAERVAAKRITVRTVATVVAKYFRAKLRDIRGPGQSRSVMLPRSVAMYLSRECTGLSLAAIGREFGGRDHTTVLHACRKIDELLVVDPTMQNTVSQLRQSLAQKGAA